MDRFKSPRSYQRAGFSMTTLQNCEEERHNSAFSVQSSNGPQNQWNTTSVGAESVLQVHPPTDPSYDPKTDTKRSEMRRRRLSHMRLCYTTPVYPTLTWGLFDTLSL